MKIIGGLIVAVILSLLAIGLSAYSLMGNTQANAQGASNTQSTVPIADSTIGIGQQFNWTIGEIVNVQGNLYVYQGHDGGSLYFARWQNVWMELVYHTNGANYLDVALYPYKIQIRGYNDNFAVVQFLT